MKRIAFAPIIVFVALVGLAGSARAVSLTITTNQPTYLVGETVTVTVTGDTLGGSDSAIFGRLVYSDTLTDTVGSSQTLHTSPLGSWTPGVLSVGDGFADVFNQSRSGSSIVLQNQIATATLTATGIGTVNLSWSSGPALDFFGMTSAPSASFTIVPEPGTALLFGLGLAGIAFAGRRRA